MNRFIATIEGKRALLNPEESFHCAKVLRQKAGEAVELIDGKGNFYEGQLTRIHEKQCEAEITSGPFIQQSRPYQLHLAIAPTKNIDRTEWMLEKAVEIGIDEVSFIRCRNSERTVLKHDRMQKIAESAVKQSKQALIPVINDLRKFDELLETKADLKLIAYCGDAEKSELRRLSFDGKKVLILIGPEGDFSREELVAALSKGFQVVSLGNSRLRTETAGLAAVMTLAIKS
jgi:16S rRNA (uracil1498-N3)-methyltransferase